MNKSGLLTPSVPKWVLFIADCRQLLITALALTLQQTGTANVTSTEILVRIKASALLKRFTFAVVAVAVISRKNGFRVCQETHQ
jgi:hypothetical protein